MESRDNVSFIYHNIAIPKHIINICCLTGFLNALLHDEWEYKLQENLPVYLYA